MVAGTVGVILRGANQGCLTREEAIKLLNKLKANEFRIHPNIIYGAIDSVEDFDKGVKRMVDFD